MDTVAARADGRAAADARPLRLRVGGAVAAARGSAYAEFCGARVLAAVRGPAAPVASAEAPAWSARGALEVSVEVAAFAAEGGYVADAREDAAVAADDDAREAEERHRGRESALSHALRAALLPAVLAEEFPKAAVRIDVLVLESDGDVFAACAAASSAALVDAGVPMRDLVTGATVARVGAGLLVDPSAAEVAQARGGATIACMGKSEAMTLWELDAVWTTEEAQGAMEAAAKAAAHADEELRVALREALE